MYPFAEQILGFRAHERHRRIGGLILEVKGDFCHRVQRSSKSTAAPKTISRSAWTPTTAYNPLHNDLDAYALAYGIASLLNNLYGEARSPSGSRPTRTS